MAWSFGQYLAVLQELVRSVGMILGEVAKLKARLDEALPAAEAAVTRGAGPDTLEVAGLKLDAVKRELEAAGDAEKQGTLEP